MTRDEFRNTCLKRDGNKCVVCHSAVGIHVHHILERRLFSDGGYHPDNGVSVCEKCHILAEQTRISPESLRDAAGITNVYIPNHLYRDAQYDKWGNQIISENRRLRGELFFDESVQKILKGGNVLSLYTSWVKYPRTHHLPNSPGMERDDRRIAESTILYGDEDVVATIKMDGENTSIYSDHIHARSLDSEDHISRHWVKNLWSTLRGDIPAEWRLCGENLWAKHSIGYDSLESYFYGFSIWNEVNTCLCWDETLEWFELLGITPVPVFYRGPYDLEKIHEVFTFGPGKDLDRCEGYVIRVAADFPYRDFRSCVAKWVRPRHVQTAKHWFRGQAIERNSLKG